jgi:hypothetical protein
MDMASIQMPSQMSRQRQRQAAPSLAASVLKSSIKEVEHQVCWRTSGAKEASSSLRSKLGGICIFLVNRRFLIFYSATTLFTKLSG